MYGLLAFPVLSELPSDPEAELSMLDLLGGTLSKESRLYKALNELTPSVNHPPTHAENTESIRAEIIESIRAEILKDYSKTKIELEKWIKGTEWHLIEQNGHRLGRFSTDSVMEQQTKIDKWDNTLPGNDREYNILSANSIKFAKTDNIGTFNEDFTRMTCVASKGKIRKGKSGHGRLVMRFELDHAAAGL